MSTAMQAIKLSKLENDLTHIRRHIKKHEGIINSINTTAKMKRESTRKLTHLVKERDMLMDKITEEALL